MKTLISADNTWALFAILVVIAALAIWMEQKYKWAGKVTGCVIALIGAMILSNIRVIPTDAPAYDFVWSYVVPLAVPLLLFNANVKKIWKESGRVLVIYLISGIGTLVGGIVAFYLLHNQIADLNKIAAMMVGSYTGGSVNMVAMSDAFGASGDMVSSSVVADNLLMALYFFVLIAIPTIKFFLKKFKHPYIDEVEARKASGEGENQAASYWKAKPVALIDIAEALAIAFAIVAISTAIADFFAGLIPTSNFGLALLNGLLGNKYLIMPTLTMLLATIKPEFMGNIGGAQEIGTFLIHIFFAVIGVPASIYLIMTQAVFMPQNAFLHATYFTLRSGGKTVVTFFFDSVFVWIVSVPIAFVLSRFTGLFVVVIFACVNIADWIKCVIGFVLVKKGVWLQNIVSQKE